MGGVADGRNELWLDGDGRPRARLDVPQPLVLAALQTHHLTPNRRHITTHFLGNVVPVASLYDEGHHLDVVLVGPAGVSVLLYSLLSLHDSCRTRRTGPDGRRSTGELILRAERRTDGLKQLLWLLLLLLFLLLLLLGVLLLGLGIICVVWGGCAEGLDRLWEWRRGHDQLRDLFRLFALQGSDQLRDLTRLTPLQTAGCPAETSVSRYWLGSIAVRHAMCRRLHLARRHPEAHTRDAIRTCGAVSGVGTLGCLAQLGQIQTQELVPSACGAGRCGRTGVSPTRSAAVHSPSAFYKINRQRLIPRGKWTTTRLR
mmetsp:Transcript_48916/g.122553  ORF Transcript_48916/g.122553 Transcript_48916/m.122553 type:complete len:314 (+) Transcript_48916:953-1894(+)